MGHATTLLLVSDLHRSLAVEGDRRRVPAPQTRAAQASPNLVRRSTKSVRTDSERGLGEAKKVDESTSKDKRREEKGRTVQSVVEESEEEDRGGR